MTAPPFPPIKTQHDPRPLSAQQSHAFDRPAAAGGLRFETKRRLLGGCALILVLVLGFWYFSHGGNAARTPHLIAPPVRVATIQRRNMAVVEHTVGTVLPMTAVQVTTQASGVIDSVHFKEGQIVKKGDLLFQINPEPYQAALKQAKGQLAKDQATLAGKRADLKRFQALLTENAVSQQMVGDEAATVATDEGVVQADEANVEMAQIHLNFTQIRSPIDGQTGAIMIHPGNYAVIPGSTTTSPLVTINQIQPIMISFSLPQSELPRIHARQKGKGLVATIHQQGEGGATLSAPVDFVSNNVNNITGTIELRATFKNEDALLVPGQLVNVIVELTNLPDAAVVPREAVNIGPDGQYVYVVSPENKAIQRPIQVLFDDGTDAAIRGDVKPGDQVIVEGQLRVVPGVSVVPEGGKSKLRRTDAVAG